MPLPTPMHPHRFPAHDAYQGRLPRTDRRCGWAFLIDRQRRRRALKNGAHSLCVRRRAPGLGT